LIRWLQEGFHMARKLFALGAAALALLMLSAVDPAEARRGGHGGHGARSFGGPFHRSGPSRFVGSHHHRHYYQRRFFIGAPLAFGFYGYAYYSGSCRWLRSRALYTGSPYWWDRYEACINGY
jgi:hypothetical protein